MYVYVKGRNADDILTQPFPLRPVDADDLDRLGNPLDLDDTRIGERYSCRLCRLPACEDLIRFGDGSDTRGNVNSLATEAASRRDRVGCMDADAHRWREAVVTPMLGERSLDRHGARKGCSRVLEGDKEAVARVVDLVSSMLAEEGPKRPVVPLDEVEPGLVAGGLDEIRRSADVTEDERSGHGLGALASQESAARRTPATAPRRAKIACAASSSRAAVSSSLVA